MCFEKPDEPLLDAPYVPIEPGVSVGWLIGPVSFYTHQAPILTPIHDVQFHFLWGMHIGAGIRLAKKVEIATEISGLMRATDDFREEKLHAWSFDPGIRLITGKLQWELSARIGLTEDAQAPFGHVTTGIAVCWAPGR